MIDEKRERYINPYTDFGFLYLEMPKFLKTEDELVHAFLLLSYADSTQEEIAVPMVEHDGRWLMK